MRGSPRPRAGSVALITIVAVLAACGSSTSSSPQHCASSAECPANARCVSNGCVANASPVADVALPADPIEANAVVSFDASASRDPDAGDAIASYAWTFQASPETPCAPPAVASTVSVATVRFACPGHYAGELTVTDRLGATATKTFAVEVVPYVGPARVIAGPDVSVDHVCTRSPLHCTTAEPIAVSASAPGLPAEAVTFTWKVEPPPGSPVETHRRVEFSPSENVAAPTVSIDTDGQAISGDWVLRVEARDAAGLIGSAATRVSIGNRPPVIEAGPVPVPDHTFDGAQFRASGEVAYTISDPDGDLVSVPLIEPHHVGDGGGTLTGVLLADPPRVRFDVSVPYATRSDAAFLIGGAGLERTIVFGVTDANDATTTLSWPIVVANRPPRLDSTPSAAFTVDHTYDGAASAYRASVPLSAWSDPDGDPLFQKDGSGTGDPICATFSVAAGSGSRVATADCALAFTGTPNMRGFAGNHGVRQEVQDPWAPAPAADERIVAFEIANHAPTITSVSPEVVSGSCRVSGACGFEGTETKYSASPVTVNLSRWTDPDGDPISVVASTGTPDVVPVQPWVCAGACSLPVDFGAMTICGGSVFQSLSLSVSDGNATASGRISLERSCGTY